MKTHGADAPSLSQRITTHYDRSDVDRIPRIVNTKVSVLTYQFSAVRKADILGAIISC